MKITPRFTIDIDGMDNPVFSEPVDTEWHKYLIKTDNKGVVRIYKDGILKYETEYDFPEKFFYLQIGERSGGSRAQGIKAYHDSIVISKAMADEVSDEDSVDKQDTDIQDEDNDVPDLEYDS